ARDRAALLALGDRGGERLVALLAPLLALAAQPFDEVGQVVEVEVAEQLGAAGVLVAADRRERRCEVAVDVARERHRRAGLDERGAAVAAEAKDPLAQAGVGLARRG